jgi:hypothetical protein
MFGLENYFSIFLAPQLVHHGDVDFLVADYLSEITMSLLTAARRKKPDMGYTPDFIEHCIRPLISNIKQKGVRVVTNAGGINPEGCVKAIKDVASAQGVELSVAMVTGDDLMKDVKEVREKGYDIEMETGQPLPQSILSMNAYTGGFPIADALDKGADIVITGRCTDSALVLGPLIHKFGWKETDLDLLASGSLAGHLIECGAQATGGIFTDWPNVDGWDNIGFPIVECDSDGSFIVTKPPNTGGVVNFGTIAEQLTYEIGDPARYILPDVSCDFSNVTITQLSADRVQVTGARGNPPPPTYKVSATYLDGYRAIAVCPSIGGRAKEKALKTSNAILKRTRRILNERNYKDFNKTIIHIMGGESEGLSEAVSWMGVQHDKKEPVEIFSQEIAPAGTGMAPGLTTLVGGRPKVSPVLKLFSFLYPKDLLPLTVSINEDVIANKSYTNNLSEIDTSNVNNSNINDGNAKVVYPSSDAKCVQDIAYLRSGDKGNNCNIGVISRDSCHFSYLKQILTEQVVAEWFKDLLEPSENETIYDLVSRYELPGISGLNFVLRKSLGGGGVSSLRPDPQGKGYGQRLGAMPLPPK